jgi:PAS domain S-box-containing protein
MMSIKPKKTLHAILENGFDAVILINTSGEILKASSSTKKILGYKPQELVGSDGFALVYPNDVAKAKNTLTKLQRYAKKSVVIETRVRQKNGNWLWVEVIGTNLLNDPEVAGIVVSIRDITKRKEAEEELRLSKERFRALFAQSPLSIQIFSPDGWTIEVNHAWEMLWGAPAELVKDYNILQDQQLVDKGVMTYVRKGFAGEAVETPVVVYDPREIGKPGRPRYVKALIFPVKDNTGKITQVVLKHIDVTDLIESEEKYRVLAQTSPDGILVTNEQGIITYINPALNMMFANPIKGVIGTDYKQYLTKKSAAKAEKIFLALTKGKPIKNIEFEAIHHSGHVFPIEVSASPMMRHKHFRGVECVVRDISQRKRAEKRQNLLDEVSFIVATSIEQEVNIDQIMKLIVPAAADYCRIVLVDENNKIKEKVVAHADPKQIPLVEKLYANFGDWNSGGYQAEKIIKLGKAEFIPTVDGEMLRKIDSDAEMLPILKRLHPVSYIGVPLKARNKILGAIIFLSVKKTRLFSNDDFQFAKELGNRIALALDNAWLYQEAQEAIMLRDEFISVASHELKTPVTSLKLYTQTLKRLFGKKKEGGLIHYFDKIDGQTDKLITLVNDLLSVSRLQHDKLEFKMREFNFNKLVEETVSAMQETKPSRTIIVEGMVKKKVYGDSFRISQVLTNLLSNAIKYSPGTDKVVVKVIEDSQAVIVSVQDFGIGIDKRQQNKIFRPFYRVTSLNERTYPGLGMGLYIASAIVLRHKGRMTVKSQKGKGSVFSFTLPFRRNQE